MSHSDAARGICVDDSMIFAIPIYPRRRHQHLTPLFFLISPFVLLMYLSNSSCLPNDLSNAVTARSHNIGDYTSWRITACSIWLILTHWKHGISVSKYVKQRNNNQTIFTTDIIFNCTLSLRTVLNIVYIVYVYPFNTARMSLSRIITEMWKDMRR